MSTLLIINSWEGIAEARNALKVEPHLLGKYQEAAVLEKYLLHRGAVYLKNLSNVNL